MKAGRNGGLHVVGHHRSFGFLQVGLGGRGWEDGKEGPGGGIIFTLSVAVAGFRMPLRVNNFCTLAM